MTSAYILVTVLVVLGLAIAVIGLRVLKPNRREHEAIEAVRALAQQELRDWTRRHSKSGLPK